MTYLLQALFTIVQMAFGLYLTLVMLRFLLQSVRADFYNPISQIVVKLTGPPLRWLRRFIPGYAGIDWPCLALLFMVQGLELVLLAILLTGHLPNLAALAVLCVAHLLQLGIWVYIICVTIAVVISWVNPHAYNPATVLIYQLTDPVLSRIRKHLPDTGGLDLSPMVLMLAGFLLQSLLVAPLLDWGNILNGISMRIL